MSTYLELVRNTRILCGMQGTGPSSVATAQGPEEILAHFVRDSYIDIQNLREDWEWMEASGSFSTEADKDTYNAMDIFFSSTLPLKKYQKDSFIIEANRSKRYLQFIDRNVLEAETLNSTQTGVPTRFTIDPSTFSVILKDTPDGVYTVSFRYQKNPQILSADSDVPKLPLAFHKLIEYIATDKMSVYLGSPEIYSRYSHASAVMMGQLMRIANPKKSLQFRPFV